MAFHATELIFDSHFGYGFNGISKFKKKQNEFVCQRSYQTINFHRNRSPRMAISFYSVDKNENGTQKTLFHYKH